MLRLKLLSGPESPMAPTGDYIQKNIPRRVGSLTISNLGSILNWFITGKLFAYANNRGNGRISRKTSESAFQGVREDSLGECTIGKAADGQMVLADFHSRLAGFYLRYAKGLMTEKELKTPISVRVVENHLDSYQSLNAGDPHRTKDKIKNPDLAYGSIIESIEEAVGPNCMKLIGENKWTVLSSIIYNLAQSKDRNWTWPKVYQKRIIAMNVANEKAGTLVISNADMKALVEAILYWYHLMDALRERAKETDNNVKKILGNAGLFGFIVCDRMWAKPTFSTTNVMVKKIIRNLAKVQKATPELCRGNRDTVIEYSLQLDAIFKAKKTENEEVEIAA